MSERRTASIVSIFAIACASCASQTQSVSSFGDYSVGRPFAEYKALLSKPTSYANRSGWKERSYDLPNGNWVYVAPMNGFCAIYWEIDKAGTIVRYGLEGEGCD
jgi:hypothetical protein